MAQQIMRYCADFTIDIDRVRNSLGKNKYVSFLISLHHLRLDGVEFPSRKELVECCKLLKIPNPITVGWFNQYGVEQDFAKHGLRRVDSIDIGDDKQSLSTIITINETFLELIEKDGKALRGERYKETITLRQTSNRLAEIRDRELFQFNDPNRENIQMLDPVAIRQLELTRLQTFYLYQVMPPDVGLNINKLEAEWLVGTMRAGVPIKEKIRVSAQNYQNQGIAVLMDLLIVWILDTAFTKYGNAQLEKLPSEIRDACANGDTVMLQRVIKNEFIVNLGEICDALNRPVRYAQNVFESIYRLRTTHYVSDFSQAPQTRSNLGINDTVFDYQPITSLGLSVCETEKDVVDSPPEIEYSSIVTDNSLEMYQAMIRRHGARKIFLRISFPVHKYIELLVKIGSTYRKFIADASYVELKTPIEAFLTITARINVNVNAFAATRLNFVMPIDILQKTKACSWADYTTYKRALLTLFINAARDSGRITVAEAKEATTVAKREALLSRLNTIEACFSGFVFTLIYDVETIRDYEADHPKDISLRSSKLARTIVPLLKIERNRDDLSIGDKSLHNRLTATTIAKLSHSEVEDNQPHVDLTNVQ